MRSSIFTAIALAKRQRLESQRMQHGRIVFGFRIRRGEQFFADKERIRSGNKKKRAPLPAKGLGAGPKTKHWGGEKNSRGPEHGPKKKRNKGPLIAQEKRK